MDKNKFDATKFSVQPFVNKVEKPWGYEIHWAQTPEYTGKIIHINKGKRLSLQYHDQKMETQCLLNGKVVCWLDNQEGEYVPVEMELGKGYTVVPFQRHRLEAIEDADVLEVSSPESGTTFRLEDDYKRPDETEELRKAPDRGWDKK